MMKKSEVDRFAEDMAGKMGVVFKVLSLGLKKRLCVLNIGPAHMKVLFLLCALEQEPTISKISRSLSISLAMMTRIIDRLEEKKIVSRRADPRDRRAIRIRITEKGRHIAHELDGLRKRELKKLLNSFDKKDRKKFMKALSTVSEVVLKYEKQ
jgi:DNA-binding MarR family transcriptional regulator